MENGPVIDDLPIQLCHSYISLPDGKSKIDHFPIKTSLTVDFPIKLSVSSVI
jgi:hypothetical protein